MDGGRPRSPSAASWGSAPTELIALLRRSSRTRARQQLFGKTEPPITLGRFEIERPLGAGGAGTVFRARDPELDRLVALKVVEPRPSEIEAVRSEARLIASLSDPHVVGVHEVGSQGALTYLVMEEVDGPTLAEWLASDPPVSARLEAFLGAARGLLACHRCGIVHRDFKPANVVMASDGRPRVVDFGLALRTDEGESASWGGTLSFMAPEQLANGPVTASVDVFAFCVALFRGMTGQDPFPTEPGEDRRLVMRRTKLDLSGIQPSSLRPILRDGLSFDPADRPASMEPLIEALEAALSPPRGRRAFVVAGIGLLGASAMAIAAYASRPDPRFEGVAVTPSPSGARRLLWVDDNPRYNRAEIEHLRRAGWAVEFAMTTEEAVRKGGFDKYAAILSDLERQDEGGFAPNAGLALIRRVRSAGATTPVIIYTSSRMVDVLGDTVQEAGGDAIAGTTQALYDAIGRTAGEP